ncbi:MAG: NAD-dependent epimerase/dehydratase family protein [Chloroflexota bacterium]
MGKILLTGAAGFIGWRTAELLLERGEEVVGVDNLNDYYDPRLKLWRLSQLESRKGFKFYRADIESLESTREIFERERPDAVINLAARAGVRASIENPFVYATTNFMGTLNILETMKDLGVEKLVLASSSSLYAGEEIPFSEELPVNRPISPYAATKKAAEAIAYSYKHLYGIDSSVLRFFTVYGPAGRPDMSYYIFMNRIWRGEPIEVFGDGTQTRDFTFVEDIARGVVASLKPLGYEIINLGGGRTPVELNYMIELIEKGLGKKAEIIYKPFHSADMSETGADVKKAARLLDWRAEVEFEEGIARTVEWFKGFNL